jgi:hypothetical protein
MSDVLSSSSSSDSVGRSAKRARIGKAKSSTRPGDKEHVENALAANKSVTVRIGTRKVAVDRSTFYINANVTNRIKTLVTFQVGDVAEAWLPCFDRLERLYNEADDKKAFVSTLMDDATRIRVLETGARVESGASLVWPASPSRIFVFVAARNAECFAVAKLILLAVGSKSSSLAEKAWQALSKLRGYSFDDTYAKAHGCMSEDELVAVRLVPPGLRLDNGCWQPELLPYAAKAVAGDPSECRSFFDKLHALLAQHTAQHTAQTLSTTRHP